ncbi:tail fiber protein [Bradyrhizobium symbiodeficiens]|uniref:Phage tail protein n=1 Tax=Bradyrhizobium symbiodeficiens TaxID=1404367 RepID=A0A6G9A7U6_9BRAD|nr:tail fiber protein [Bradyrhizobium symbiodeficiens]QIP08547.1 tail fiber protein [Bradyrhizobium symbiodeficiens]
MTLYKWSQTASADATADSTINWAEGQSPASVNDSARAMMAAIAKYRDDVAGAIVSSGTSTAYAVNTYQVFQSLSQLDGQVIAFTPHTTNGATVTINVDSLGAKPLRSAPGGELPAGVLIQGTPYAAHYNNADAAFYLAGFFNNPYNVPIGSCIDFFGAMAPNSSFVLAYGQAVSRTAYPTLFSIFGVTYGSGDGSTTFNIPDCRGRIVAGRDDMGGATASRLSSSYFGGAATSLGATGGAESHPLTVSQHATLTSSGTITVYPNGDNTKIVPVGDGGFTLTNAQPGSAVRYVNQSGGTAVSNATFFSGSNSLSTSGTGGSTGAAHNNVQPTIIANKLIRVI